MTLEQYANIAEILGVTIVIITVGFLALQIQQSNKLMAGEAQRARSQYAGQAMSAIAENGELAAIMVKDVNGETLNAVEELRMKWMWMRHLWGYQTSFQQLPREEIEPAANFFRRNFETMPFFRTAWEQNREGFQRDFVQYMEENVFNR